jgi:hypothetical protein
MCIRIRISWLKNYPRRELESLGIMKIFIIYPLVVLFLFILTGLAIFCYGMYELMQAANSSSWPTAEGMIKECKISSSSSVEGRDSFAADVIYEYNVMGKIYTGNKIRMSKVYAPSESYAHEDMKNYPIGKVVKVYYSSGNPEHSVLEPGIHLSSWIIPIFGFVFFLFSLGLFIFIMKFAKATNSSRNSFDA